MNITFGKFELSTENGKELALLGLGVVAVTYAFAQVSKVAGKIAEREDLPEVLKSLSWVKPEPEGKSNVSYLKDYKERKKLIPYE